MQSSIIEADQVKSYWLRLEERDVEEPAERRLLRIEKYDEPCVVGFQVDKKESCPLFRLEPSVKTTGELLAVIKRVSAFRMAQVADGRS